MKLRLTRSADRDIDQILRQTIHLFGIDQFTRYGQLIERALAMIKEAPERPSCLDRDDIRPGLKSFHVSLAAGRRDSAAHKIFFALRRTRAGVDEIVVFRILHEASHPVSRQFRDT